MLSDKIVRNRLLSPPNNPIDNRDIYKLPAKVKKCIKTIPKSKANISWRNMVEFINMSGRIYMII